MSIDLRIVTRIEADTCDSDESRQKVTALFEKLELKCNPHKFQIACLGKNDPIVIAVNGEVGIVAMTNLRRNEPVLGKFPTQAPFKEGEMSIAPVFNEVWCRLDTRPLTYLEELGFKYIELQEADTALENSPK